MTTTYTLRITDTALRTNTFLNVTSAEYNSLLQYNLDIPHPSSSSSEVEYPFSMVNDMGVQVTYAPRSVVTVERFNQQTV